MEAYRIKTTALNGDISLRDYAFSQVCEYFLAGLSEEERDHFWDHDEVTLPSGRKAMFVKEV